MASSVFRVLRTADASECARLHAQAFTPGWTAEDFREQATRADRVMTGAVRREPALAGFVVSRVVGGEADLMTIVVDRAARRGGIGAGLLAHHLSALVQARAHAVFLEVATDNVAARALYARYGFAAVGARKGYYAGGRGDAVVLRCDL